MRDAALDGKVQSSAVRTGLAAGNNLQASQHSVIHGLGYTPKTCRFPERTDDVAK
jgi:hypothetical protein